MKFYDNHTHSHFSPDSRMTLEEEISSACNLPLKGISITDHLDLEAPVRKDEFIFDPTIQQKEIDRLSVLYNIEIFKGIEIGLQPQSLQKIKEFTQGLRFDVVIASIHFIDGTDPYYGSYYKGKDYKQAYGRALEVIYQTATAYKDFDILGHFDYIARYSPYSVRDIMYCQFREALDPILQFLAQEGKALEINTNTYRERNGYTPILDTAILKRFKELGGQAISLGSDAHDTQRIAENFQKYYEIIKSSGFNYLVYFKERKPVFYKPTD